MDEKKFSLERFEPGEASREAFEAFTTLENVFYAETNPDDPPFTVDYVLNYLTNNSDSAIRLYYWVVKERGKEEWIARGIGQFPLLDNRHRLFFDVYVHPDFRRHGIGKMLLEQVLQAAEKEERRLIMGFVHGSIPAGEEFCKRIEAEKGLEEEENQVKIEDVDRDLMRQWIERAQERAAGFELGFWEGLPPEKELEAVCELESVMNSAPRGDLEIEDSKLTPDQLRENEDKHVKRGNVHWWAYVREVETGELAGFTDVMWNPETSYLLSQHNTGVLPKFRGRGLGRWLKAAMFEKVAAERPEVTLIRTFNAASNDAMLKINHEMGFKLYDAGAVWQVDAEKVKSYLGK